MRLCYYPCSLLDVRIPPLTQLSVNVHVGFLQQGPSLGNGSGRAHTCTSHARPVLQKATRMSASMAAYARSAWESLDLRFCYECRRGSQVRHGTGDYDCELCGTSGTANSFGADLTTG